MREILPDNLKQAVKEYYDWLGDRNGKAVKHVTCKNGIKSTLLLARFIDCNGKKLSSLMVDSGWADGHYDVTEIYTFCRECEKEMVNRFINSPNGTLLEYELYGIPDGWHDDEEDDYDDTYELEYQEDDYALGAEFE